MEPDRANGSFPTIALQNQSVRYRPLGSPNGSHSTSRALKPARGLQTAPAMGCRKWLREASPRTALSTSPAPARAFELLLIGLWRILERIRKHESDRTKCSRQPNSHQSQRAPSWPHFYKSGRQSCLVPFHGSPRSNDSKADMAITSKPCGLHCQVPRLEPGSARTA